MPDLEIWDEKEERFLYTHGCTLKLEHSLLSIQKWESKWHKPFLTKDSKTFEEIADYVRCMTLNEEDVIDEGIYSLIPQDIMSKILDYLQDPMSAIPPERSRGKKIYGPRKRTITAEIIYCRMILLNIPIEFQKWHINRLMTLIDVMVEESEPSKKMSKREILEQNRRINEERLKKLNTRG